MPELDGELWRDMYYASFDDLRLYVRHYPAPESKAEACRLPARSHAQLPRLPYARELSVAIIRSSRASVYCVDYRGRGGSQYDRHWRNYTPFIELIDTLDFMTLQDLHKAAIVGTSRGGIIAMLMAAVRPTAMGAVVLNDIGPVIETRGLGAHHGLCRTHAGAAQVGTMPHIAARDERACLSGFNDAQWEEIAREVFDERNGKSGAGL